MIQITKSKIEQSTSKFLTLRLSLGSNLSCKCKIGSKINLCGHDFLNRLLNDWNYIAMVCTCYRRS